MSSIESSRACLRIFGDDLIPGEISAALGSEPTASETRGDVLRSVRGTERVVKQGSWRLVVTETTPEDTDAQVRELLSKLSSNLQVWRDISTRFDVDLFCGWSMSRENDMVGISSKTLLDLGERGIALTLDIYATDADE